MKTNQLQGNSEREPKEDGNKGNTRTDKHNTSTCPTTFKVTQRYRNIVIECLKLLCLYHVCQKVSITVRENTGIQIGIRGN